MFLFTGVEFIKMLLITGVFYAVTRFVQSPRIKFKSNDGEYHDGKQDEQTDLQERGHGLDDGLQDHLETWTTNRHR